MSEANKQLVRDMWSALGEGNTGKLREVYDENVVYHGSGGEERKGREAAIEFAQTYLTAFPDMKTSVEQIVAEGDFVVARVNPTGTNTGEFMGMAPTGKAVDLKWVMNMVRISNGKVVEEWEIFDQADFMKQLGMA